MFSKLILWLSGSLGAIATFLKPIAEKEAGKLLAALLPIALGVVTQVATTGKLPNEKRDLAYSQLKEAAVSAGLDASSSVLNSAIELAYQRFQAAQS